MVLWVPVLNLQEQFQMLEIYCGNGTLAAEHKPHFLLQWAHPKTHLVPGAQGLQALQAQLSRVHTSQEQLRQQVDNLTQNPGTTTPSFCGAEDETQGFHACGMSTLPTELQAQPAKQAFWPTQMGLGQGWCGPAI